jgi:hypothetical protein
LWCCVGIAAASRLAEEPSTPLWLYLLVNDLIFDFTLSGCQTHVSKPVLIIFLVVQILSNTPTCTSTRPLQSTYEKKFSLVANPMWLFNVSTNGK